MSTSLLLSAEQSVLLIIDMQERLMADVVRALEITRKALRMIRTAQTLKIPILVTEQNPKVFGATLSEIRQALANGYNPVEKLAFNCFGSPDFQKHWDIYQRRQIMVVGIETHICVAQSALHALAKGFQVHLLEDAVSAHTEQNHQIGVEKMKLAGVVPSSTEMALFELLKQAGTAEFRALLPLLKDRS